MKLIARILLAAFAYVLGVVITGMIAPALHIPQMRGPVEMNPSIMMVALLLSAPLLTAACFPLAQGMRGTWTQRFLSLALLLFTTIGLNTMIEAKVFSDMVPGSAFGAALNSLLPCLFAAAVLTPRGIRTDPDVLGHFPVLGWSWRLLLAWAAFPVCYWLFGMCVAPFVLRYYESGTLGIHVPPPLVILQTQWLRSALFLAASFPGIVLWRKSRWQFIFAMGLAHAFAVGVFQLAAATFFPVALRIAHSVEIMADSFAYAAVLGFLFIATRSEARGSRAAPVTAAGKVA